MAIPQRSRERAAEAAAGRHAGGRDGARRSILTQRWLFLDFEASSLSKDSYPIEVGWVDEDGVGEAHLIRPAPSWIEWDDRAAAIHRVTREQLADDGEPVEDVCACLIDLAATHRLLASAPSWDGHWLSMLLRAAGRPRHLIRLEDTDVAFDEAAAQYGDAAADVVARARAAIAATPPGHRALADARREWSIWRAIAETGR